MSFGLEALTQFGGLQIRGDSIGYYHDATHTMIEDRWEGITLNQASASHYKDVTCHGVPVIAIDIPVVFSDGYTSLYTPRGVALAGMRRLNATTWRIYANADWDRSTVTIHVFRPFDEATPGAQTHGMKIWTSTGDRSFTTEAKPLAVNVFDTAVVPLEGVQESPLVFVQAEWNHFSGWYTSNFGAAGGYSMIGMGRDTATLINLNNARNWMFAKLFAQDPTNDYWTSHWGHVGGNSRDTVLSHAYILSTQEVERYMNFIPTPVL